VPTPREQLASLLRQSRLDAGYESHGALAKKLNVSRPVVSKAENPAQPVPSDAVLAAWAGATGVALDTLTDLAQRAKSGTPDWFMPYRQAESPGEHPAVLVTLAGAGRPSDRELYACRPVGRALHGRTAGRACVGTSGAPGSDRACISHGGH